MHGQTPRTQNWGSGEAALCPGPSLATSHDSSDLAGTPGCSVGCLTDVRLTLSMGPGGAWGVEGGERECSWCWQGAPRAESHREPHRITARGRPEPREASPA